MSLLNDLKEIFISELLPLSKEAVRALKIMAICQKEVWTVEDVSLYTKLSVDYINKLTSKKLISYSKPFGKVNYFDRDEVIARFKCNKISSNEDVNERADQHLAKNTKGDKRWR